jgi:tRNA U34 5-carboxymethylaminomethyl modifying enzyme MnmG/GidA
MHRQQSELVRLVSGLVSPSTYERATTPSPNTSKSRSSLNPAWVSTTVSHSTLGTSTENISTLENKTTILSRNNNHQSLSDEMPDRRKTDPSGILLFVNIVQCRRGTIVSQKAAVSILMKDEQYNIPQNTYLQDLQKLRAVSLSPAVPQRVCYAITRMLCLSKFHFFGHTQQLLQKFFHLSTLATFQDHTIRGWTIYCLIIILHETCCNHY